MAGLTSLKVEKRLLGRQAAEAIRSSIITGVPPSERLLEVQLAKQLEVSRGPSAPPLPSSPMRGWSARSPSPNGRSREPPSPMPGSFIP